MNTNNTESFEFKNYKIGDDYPWRSFSYNHTPDFLAIYTTEADSHKFTLSLVKDGKYRGFITEAASDQEIEEHLSSVNHLVDERLGFHIRAHSASAIRQYVKESARLDIVITELEERICFLDNPISEIIKLSEHFSEDSLEYQLFMHYPKSILKENADGDEYEIDVLVKVLENLFNDAWYYGTDKDDLHTFGMLIETYCECQKKDPDLPFALNTELLVSSLLHFREMVQSSSPDFFEEYCAWNQPDYESLKVIMEMYDLITPAHS